jgi:hypothetical protein
MSRIISMRSRTLALEAFALIPASAEDVNRFVPDGYTLAESNFLAPSGKRGGVAPRQRGGRR